MRTTIEFPESVYRKGEKVAHTQSLTIEELITSIFERELKAAPGCSFAFQTRNSAAGSIEEPATLDLKDFNFDDLLA